jgi:hypothetical protein
MVPIMGPGMAEEAEFLAQAKLQGLLRMWRI